jgi:phage baseplate assembly protein V
VIREIDRRINKALGHLRLAFRSVLTRLDTGGPVQLAQADGLAGEQLQDNELMQHYGFTSAPLPGTMAVVLPIGGKTAHGILIATEHASYRLKGLESGEVALYTDEGDSIVLRRGRLIEVTTQTLQIDASEAVEITSRKVTINASETIELHTPMVHATAAVAADGDITDLAQASGRSMATMREVFNAHTHHENDAHGETNKPTQEM